MKNTASDFDKQIQNMPISYAEINGAKLAYREFGKKNSKPLILIVGYTGVMENWSSKFVYALAEEYHVITYDHRGMGYSTDDGEQYEFIQLADDCVKLMNSLGYEKFNVVGHSMGSMLTQLIVVTYPDNINKAVIISTLPSINCPEGALIKSETKKIIEQTDENNSNGIYRESVASVSNDGVFNELRNVKNDIMVMVGTDDMVTPEQGAIDVALEIKGAWLVRFKGCSHEILDEMPLRSAECIKFFLDMDDRFTDSGDEAGSASGTI